MRGGRRPTSEDVRRLAFEALDAIGDVQEELDLPICPHIDETRDRMQRGVFRAIPLKRKRRSTSPSGYAAFRPPSTIVLDSRLPLGGGNDGGSELAASMARYSVTHEVVHADDYTGGDVLLLRTQEHILREHRDKLEKGMSIIKEEGGCASINSYEDLAMLWSIQYAEMVTHYRSYVVLRRRQMPQLEYIWSQLRNDFFPPTLLTYIEHQRGIKSVFEIITIKVGDYCLVDALRESESLSARNAHRYTV